MIIKEITLKAKKLLVGDIIVGEVRENLSTVFPVVFGEIICDIDFMERESYTVIQTNLDHKKYLNNFRVFTVWRCHK